MPIKKGMDERLQRDIPMEVRGINEEARTAEISLSSEDAYDRYFGPEILGHGKGEVDLGRLKTMGVLLWNHKSDVPIGRFERVWLDEQDRKVRAVVHFDEDEQSELIWSKVKTGTLKGVSVGYRVKRKDWEEVLPGEKSKCGRFTGPCWIARKWEPLEGSIVSVPADATVGVGRSLEEPEGEPPPATEKREEGGVTVTEEEKKALEQKAAEDAKKAAEAAEAKVGAKVREITALCEKFGLKTSEYLEKSVEEVKDAILEMKAKESEKSEVPTARAEITADEKDKFRAASVDALCLRGAVDIKEPATGARDLRGMSLLDLARECVERAGLRANRFDKEALIRSAMGVDDFTYVLAGGINKAMQVGYELAPATFQLWTKKGILPDFKANKRIQLSEFGNLPEIKPHGEYTRAKLSDTAEEIGLGTFGQIFSIDRRVIINDDLDTLLGVPMKQSASYRMTINYWVYYELLNGLVGGSAIFSSGNGNLVASGSGGAPSVAQISKMRTLMGKQKDIGSKQRLNLKLAFLLVPLELQTAAEQLVASVVDPAKSNATPNPFANKLQVVADPNLDDDSAAKYYGAAAPGIANTIEVAYLDGVETPFLAQQTGWNVDGTEFKIRGDFGIKVLDFRGLVMNAGA